MYTDETLRVINDNDAFTHINGVKYPSNYPKHEIAGLHLVTETEKPTGEIVVTGFHIDETYTQVWETRAKTADELTAERQGLLDQIEPRQQQLLVRWDAWTSKTWAAELRNKSNKQTLKAQAEIIDTWADEVRAQNNGITTANTKEEIQARLDRLDELDASYPNI